MAIELLDKIAPKNDGFTGMVDADQVLGGGGSGTLPDATVAASNVTQHVASINHDALLNYETDEHFTQASISIPATQVSDFDTEVSNNSSVSTNTTHRGLTNNPHGVDKTDVALGNVPNLDFSNASNITTGTLPSSVLPPVALTTVVVVASEAAQLALTAEEGDVAVRSDLNKSYMQNGGSAGTMVDWTELQTPTDSVLSVNGETGTVVLNQDEVLDGSTYVRTQNDFTDTLIGKLNGIETSADVNNISDVNATDLTNAGDSILHYHSSDRARAVHIGTQTANTISNFAAAVKLVKLDDMTTPDDNTDLNASTSKHGLLAKLGGGTTNFLRADGTWNTPAGTGGEDNTASNAGVGGVGVFKVKTGVVLNFKNINNGSSKISITDDTTNDEVDIDVVEANLALANIGGDMDDIDNGTTYVKTHNDYTDAEQTKVSNTTGTNSGDNATNTQYSSLVSNATHTGEVTGSGYLTIANDAVTYAKMQNVAANNSILGRISGAGGNVEELTVTQAKALLSVETRNVETLTLDATDISNAYIDLAQTPASTSGVVVVPIGGILQENNEDYNIITDGSTAKRVAWGGLGLEDLLESGEKISVSYSY